MEKQVSNELHDALTNIMNTIEKENKIHQFIIKFNKNIPSKQQNNNNKICLNIDIKTEYVSQQSIMVEERKEKE